MSVSWPSGCGLCCTHSHPVSTQTLGLPPQKNLQQDTEAKLLRNHGEQASQTKRLLAQPEQQTCKHECPQIKSRSLLVNMPDLVQKHFGYSQLSPLWPAHSQNRAGSCICQIRLPASDSVSFLQRRPRQHCAKSAQIWSDLDGLVRFGPNGSGPETSWCARIIGPSSGRMQLARQQFPTFKHGCVLLHPQTVQIILYKTILYLLWFWLVVSGLGQTDLVHLVCKPVCINHWDHF